MKMNRKQDENGLVAIVVATMIMVIMTLVVLGFARLMQREQREAADKSLSTQAYYAAESGINDAVQRLHDPTMTALADKATCDTSSDTTKNPSLLVGSIDTTLKASYSCLLINTAPTTLEYTQKSITTSKSTIVPMSVMDPATQTIAKIEVSWGDETLASHSYAACPGIVNFPVASTWSATTPGVLKLDLIRASGAITRAGLISGAMFSYLSPVASGGVCGTNSLAYASYTGNNAGKVTLIKCAAASTPHECVATITGLSDKTVYLRMRSIYDSSNVTVRMFDAADKQLDIKGAQVKIDTTGRVADVVRRIQVRVPTIPNYDFPESALETTLDVCKQLVVVPGVGGAIGNSCTY